MKITEEMQIVELLKENGFKELTQKEIRSDPYRKTFESIESEPEDDESCLKD